MKNNQLRDIVWYLAGAAVPAMLGLIKSPIFTRYFSPEEYGYYSLAFITFNYLSLSLYSWLTSCIYRYYLQYTENGRSASFYSTLGILYGISTLIIIATAMVLRFMYNGSALGNLFLYAAVHAIVSQANSLFLSVIKLQGKAKLFNTVHSLKSISAFGILCILTFVLSIRVEALFINLIIVEFILGITIIGIAKNKFITLLKGISIRKKDIYKFLQYGLSNFVILMSITVMNTSDRYIIALFHPMDIVGIYNQVNNLAAISLGALVTVFQNSINPYMIAELENNLSHYYDKGKDFIVQYFIFILPFTCLLSLFAEEFAFIFLGEKFRSGYGILPYVFSGTFILGLITIINAKYKFENRIPFLIKIFSFAAIINAVSTYYFVQWWGYSAAVITTVISYFGILMFVLYGDVGKHTIVEILGSIRLFVFTMLLFIPVKLYIDCIMPEFNIYISIIEASIFVAVYISLTLYKKVFS